MLPSAFDWRKLDPKEHAVHFYNQERELIYSLSAYLQAGFEQGERGLVIATQAHLMAIDDAMRARGCNLTELRQRGEYIPLNAAEMLSKFMVNGMPDHNRFETTLGRMAAGATLGRRSLRAFGEMVAILWAEGNAAAALELESLWNALISRCSFRLLCGYPMARFRRASGSEAYAHVCAHHTRLIPPVPSNAAAALA